MAREVCGCKKHISKLFFNPGTLVYSVVGVCGFFNFGELFTEFCEHAFMIGPVKSDPGGFRP